MATLDKGVQLAASLEGRGCIKFDADGGGTIRFAIPASEAAALARLLTMTEKPLLLSVAVAK